MATEITLTVAQIEQLQAITDDNGSDDCFTLSVTNLVSSYRAPNAPVVAIRRAEGETDDDTAYFIDGAGNCQQIG
jgi:hypothetical protein